MRPFPASPPTHKPPNPTMNDKQSLEDWKEYIRQLVAATAVDISETDEVRKDRLARLEADPESWFTYYFPLFASSEPAAFHRQSTRRVIENEEWYEVRVWSRELAKSTRTMMEVLYLTLVGHPPRIPGAPRLLKKYVILVSNSLDNAARLLMPFKINLEQNGRIIHDYGQQECSGKWQAAEFTTLAGIAFRALGAGQSPRGTRNEEARPDVLLFDDVDTDTDCLNPDIIAKKWRWIEEAAIGTRSVSRPATIIFCGNRIAVDCCISRASGYADSSTTINIRDALGNSSWPQKNTEAHIARVLSQKSYAAAQKEYFNNPVTEGAVFKEITYKPVLPPAAYDRLICYTDPSYTDGGDYKATVLLGSLKDEYHVLKCFLQQTTTADMIQWHRDMMHFVAPARCRYYMELVFMQGVLIKQLNDARAPGQPNIIITGDGRKKNDKHTRIEATLEPLVRSGKLCFSETERHSPHMIRLEEQFLAFAPGSRAHDDGPDAVEGAVWLLSNTTSHINTTAIATGKKTRRNAWA